MKATLGEYEGKVPVLMSAAVGAANQDYREAFATPPVIAVGQQFDAVGHCYANVVILDDVTGGARRKIPSRARIRLPMLI